LRIVFTHNLQKADTEAEAEFDSPETVLAISRALESLGHIVAPVDVDVPLARLLALLEGARPDLVFNTAEGWRGRFREAFYPALFESMGLPWVGSDAHACALTLDKHATKALVAPLGVPVPRSVFVDARDGAAAAAELPFPVIVKPNFEGSSKGIDARAVVHDPSDLASVLGDTLARYPEGVLVEEFVTGWDVVVPWIEGLGPHGGVLAPAEYRFGGEDPATRDVAIYDYTLKHADSHAVQVVVPARLEPALVERLRTWTQRVVRALNVRDMARLDWRVTPRGDVRFLEVNALPSLEPGASIYASAALAGRATVPETLETILRSACARQGLNYTTRRATRARPARVGLVYNLKRVAAARGDDVEAEFDSPDTIRAITEAIASHGHEVVGLEADRTLLGRIGAADVDVVFNIAEGIRGRGREALVPAILELLDVPYTGSDAATLAVTLDKALAKRLVREADVRTPAFAVLTSPRQRLPPELSFPLVVKPVAEGSSKGILRSSVARDEASLRAMVGDITQRYEQGALVEEFLPGREFTVGLLAGRAGRQPRVLPPMEIVFRDPSDPHPVYSFEHKLGASPDVGYEVPARVDAALGEELAATARRVWHALGCRDVARVDLRLDDRGRVAFIECNPLPGLTPDWSDLCLIAQAAGMSYRDLIGEILAPALRRHRLRRARRP